MTATLFIGNKNYSSWSLRPWLCLRWAGIPFEEKLISLAQPGYGEGLIAEVLEVSPAGRVPALKADGLALWDSLAICEWAAEEQPAAELWPLDAHRRARARVATCEMHSGFAGLRSDLPMNIHRRTNVCEWTAMTQRDIDRVRSLWEDALESNHAFGEWLFGKRSIADAFFFPVLTRFRTYGVALEGRAKAYSDMALADRDFLNWEQAAMPDSWDRDGFPKIDGLYR